MRAPMLAQSTEDRNKAKLCEALQAGSRVIQWVEGGAIVRSKSDPGRAYVVSHTRTETGAAVESCTCAAMRSPQEGDYHKAVVRWRGPDGSKRTNGVLPCGHILIARFDRQWLAADPPMRAIILASTPGLQAAIVANHYYTLEA